MEKKNVKMHSFLVRCIGDVMHGLTCAIMFVSRVDDRQRENLEAIYASLLAFLDAYYPLPNQVKNEKDS